MKEQKMIRKNKNMHGDACRGKKTKFYLAWIDMKKRCLNPNQNGYKNYGGRGIKICKIWYSYIEFKKDEFKKYQNALKINKGQNISIDRIDVNKGYCSSNVRWITKKEQNRNTRRTIRILINNKELCLKDFANLIGMNYQTLHTRFKKYKEINKAVKKPVRYMSNHVGWNNPKHEKN